MPLVWTVINPLAGITGLPVRTFTLWQVVGGLLWTVSVILAGYGLGSSISNVERYLLPIVAAVIVISLAPVAAPTSSTGTGDGTNRTPSTGLTP